MPSHIMHRFVDRQLFGKCYYKVHWKMDEPYVFLGNKHRILFHDAFSACAIAQQCYPNDANAVNAALNHITLDEMCSNDRVFADNLKLLRKWMLAREKEREEE